MPDSRYHLSASKSMSQMPFVNYSQWQPPSTSSPRNAHPRERVSIANLVNDPTLSKSEATWARQSGSGRRSVRNRSPSAQGSRESRPNGEDEEMAAHRRRLQSEKKRLWRKNLSPDQKAKRQELDAQRKREQRMNMTPEQRAEARRKDAARKAAKRRLQKEQLRSVTGTQHSGVGSSSSTSPALLSGIPLHNMDEHSAVSYALDSPGFSRSTIEDLLN